MSTRYPEVENQAVKVIRDIILEGIEEGTFRKLDVDPPLR